MKHRHSILSGTAMIALMAVASPASAEDTASSVAAVSSAAAMTDTVDIVVTGSNLRRTQAEGALPITVIDDSDIALRGGSTGADLFATLPMASPPAINESVIGSQAARGDVASVDLRGIGSGSTLMLINGRRIAAHPLSGSDQGVPALSPNANVIPTALLSRVEILRDGASAIYGADAAAGVINSILSPNRKGARVNFETALTQHGGAEEYRFGASDTFKIGRTSIGVSLDMFKRNKMMVADRDWSADSDLRQVRDLPAPWNGKPLTNPATGSPFALDNDFDNSSGINHFGQYRRGYIQSDFLTFHSSRPDGNAGLTMEGKPADGSATMAANGTFFLVPDGQGGILFKQTTPSRDLDNPENEYYDNVTKHRAQIPAIDRVNAALFVEHEFSDRVTFFGDLLYSRSRAKSQRESANIQNVNEPGIYIPMSNPFNPFGEHFYHVDGLANDDGTPRIQGAPADVTITAGLITPGTRDRYIEVNSSFYRGLAGLRGTFGDNWSWETGFLISGAYSHETETNIYRESLVRKALERTDGTAYNPFPVTFKVEGDKVVVDKAYLNPESVTAPMYDTDNRYGRTRIITWDTKLAGELFKLPFGGGRVQVAGGTEIRWEKYDSWKAPYAGLNPVGSGEDFPYLRENDNDFTSMSPNADIFASQRVESVYAEIALPVVGPDNAVPLIHRLEFGAALRHERFSIHGQSTTPKYSVLWSPTRWLNLRASYNESFRAPNLAQTNPSALLRVNYARDPYRFEATGNALDDSGPRRTFRQGNETLDPERAQNFGAGFVLDVPFVRGLSITGDYWRMKQRDAITSLGNSQVLALDELALDLATKAALAKGTPIDQINLGSGTAGYQGNSRVTRLAPTQADIDAFAAYNAAQTSDATKRAVVGEISSLINDYINLGSRTLSGIDIGVQYRSPETRFGRFLFRAEATHNLQRDEDLSDEGIIDDQLGKNGNAQWVGNARIGWAKDGWSADWLTTYYGSFADTSAATTAEIYEALDKPKYIKHMNVNGIDRYYYRVKAAVQHSLRVGYEFGGKNGGHNPHVLNFTIHNLFDVAPPIADETNGYFVGTANPRGRQFRIKYEHRF